MAEKITVGDMHRRATMPTALRRNWMKDNSAKDPVYQYAWGGRYFWVSALCLFLFIWGEVRDVPWWPWRVAELIFGVIYLAVGIWLLTSSHRFASALEKLCQEWTFALTFAGTPLLDREKKEREKEKIEPVNPSQLVEWSLSETRDRATKILRLIAGEITRLENVGKKMEAQSIRAEMFSPTHRAFRDLGLADPEWDSYFNPPHSEEEDRGQNKEESI